MPKAQLKEKEVPQWMKEADVAEDIRGLKSWVDDMGETLKYDNYRLARDIAKNIINRIELMVKLKISKGYDN